MTSKITALVDQNIVFFWIAAAAVAVLLVPLIAMQLTQAVKWSASDFAMMGLLLFGFGSVFVLLARPVPRQWRALVGILCALVFLCVWAELAVGVFTDLGS